MASKKFIAFMVSVVALVAIAYLDYKVGNELIIDQFFLLPVVIAAWFGGRLAASSMAATALIVWISVNYYTVPHYVHENDRYLNWALVLVRLLVAGTLVTLFREALDSSKRNLIEKEAALKTLRESTAKIRAYEGQFQTICAWTNQIKDGDEWISFPEFLSRHLGAQITHGISPEAAAKLKSEHQQNIFRSTE